jgi:hypothetical protein
VGFGRTGKTVGGRSRCVAVRPPASKQDKGYHKPLLKHGTGAAAAASPMRNARMLQASSRAAAPPQPCLLALVAFSAVCVFLACAPHK